MPRSSPVASVRTICRPSRPAGVGVEARPAAPAVVGDRDVQLPAEPVRRDHHLAAAPTPSLGNAVLDRVEQQLVEHHHQRGGDLGRQHAERALAAHRDRATRRRRPRSAAVATRSTIPSNSTTSSLDIDSVSCTSAIEATRRTDSSSAVRAAGVLHPAGLQAQQRRHGLQVVLHPVVDLPDGGVLGDQRAVPAAHLGDVADQHQRADRHARPASAAAPASARSRRAPRSPCGPAPRRAARPGSGSAASLPSSGSSASRPDSAARSSPTRWAAKPSRRYADCAFGLA